MFSSGQGLNRTIKSINFRKLVPGNNFRICYGFGPNSTAENATSNGSAHGETLHPSGPLGAKDKGQKGENDEVQTMGIVDQPDI